MNTDAPARRPGDASSSPTVPLITRTPDSADFFESARTGALLLRRCDECGTVRGPQQSHCPHCGAAAHAAVHADGRATLVSWAVVHRAPHPALEQDSPYVTAVVEVTEGPWLLLRLTTGDHGRLHSGMPLRIRVVPSEHEDGEPLVVASASHHGR